MTKQKAVPFPVLLKGHRETDDEQAARQLNELIEEQEKQGWRFSHVDTVKADRPMGCLFAFTPQPKIYCQLAIFEQE